MNFSVETLPAPRGLTVPRHLRVRITILCLVVGIGVGFVAAQTWVKYGGWPADADRYGAVAVPGSQVLSLPAGRLPLDRDDVMHRYGSGSRHLGDAPDGLRVTVRPAGGGPALPVERLSSSLFTSSTGARGHEPFGRIDVPVAGPYRVKARADESSSSRIIVGAPPWTPFGSAIAGGVLAFALIFAVCTFPLVLLRGAWR